MDETLKGLGASEVVPGAWLIRADTHSCLSQLATSLPGSVDLIVADPPYFVGKAGWDARRDHASVVSFNEQWLGACRDLLSPDGTVFVCGTYHSIHAVGHVLPHLGFRLLNSITWEKPNPRPCISKRYFTHSTETILWAARSEKSRHRFNDRCLRELNDGKAVRSLWRFSPPRADEKVHGRHPTQKPVALIERMVLAASAPGDVILDPFVGSGTTAVAAVRHGRRCIGIDEHQPYLDLAARRIAAEVADVRTESDDAPVV